MFLIKLLFCLTTFYVGANAALAYLLPQPKPAKFSCTQGCYVPELDRMLLYNEEYTSTDGSCLRYICYTDDGVTQIASCGALAVPSGCEKTPGNSKLPYPDCCSGIRCLQKDGTYKYTNPNYPSSSVD